MAIGVCNVHDLSMLKYFLSYNISFLLYYVLHLSEWVASLTHESEIHDHISGKFIIIRSVIVNYYSGRKVVSNVRASFFVWLPCA